MTPRRLVIALATAVALAVTAGPAAAATHVLRPTSTVGISTWTTTPLGSPLYSVLDDAITRPAKPGPGDEAKVSGAGLLWDGIVALSAPAFGAGETPTHARVAIYAEVGANSTLVATLWRGLLPVKSFSVPAGAHPGWYVSDDMTLSPDELQGLTLGLHVNALFGATQTKVMVATVEVDATDPPAAAVTPDGGGRDVGAGAPGDAGPADDTAPATDDAGDAATVPVQLDVSRPFVLGADAADVPLALGCRAGTAGGCRGRIVLQLTRPAAPKGKRARAARCARGCRVIGQADFRIAAGQRKKVKVRVARAARNLLPRGRTVRATAVITTRDAAGHTTVASRNVSIRRSS